MRRCSCRWEPTFLGFAARVLEIVADHPGARTSRPLRHEYETEGLERADLADDPITQFKRWYDDAPRRPRGAERDDARNDDARTARPDARIVLLRGVDERGFVWFTNRNSRKGRELAANPQAALVFVWLPLHRQVRVTGMVTPIDDAESDAYFATRPRESQLGAWASLQSEVLPERSTLDEAVADDRGAVSRDPRCPVPRTGVGIASRTRRSRCGRAGPTGCTTASATAVGPTAG